MANRVAIVDYGLCNVDSVRRAIEECGGQPMVTRERADLERADRIILPGVGSFDAAMANLTSLGLVEVLTEQVREKSAPFLGICLGMQLMATLGTEGGATDGLGWIAGTVTRLVSAAGERVPHVGWNNVEAGAGCALFDGIDPAADFYFVHSYRFECDLDKHVAATTPFAGGFTSAVHEGAMFGVQFHPEKSQQAGFALLKSFVAL